MCGALSLSYFLLDPNFITSFSLWALRREKKNSETFRGISGPDEKFETLNFS